MDQRVYSFYNNVWMGLKQGRIHGRFSRVLLGRGSNNTEYTTLGARRVVTDSLHRSNSLIVPIWLVFANSDGQTDGRTDRRTDRQSGL